MAAYGKNVVVSYKLASYFELAYGKKLSVLIKFMNDEIQVTALDENDEPIAQIVLNKFIHTNFSKQLTTLS